MPSWIGDRVWFNLKKIMRARTQRSGAAAQGPAQTFTVTVHRAENLALSLEKDRETIDGLVVKLQLLTKKGDILAEKQTDAIRLSEGADWSGTAEYQQEVTLSSESLKPAVALRVLLVDEDAVGFDDSEDQKDAPEHVGTASIQLSTFLPHKVASFELRGAGPAGSAGAVVLTSQGEVVRNRVQKSEAKAEAQALAKAQSKVNLVGQKKDGASHSGPASRSDHAACRISKL